VLRPGFVHTEFHERGGIDMTALPDIAWLNADDVVATALADVRRGVVISTPSLRYQVAAGFVRALPRSAVRAMGNYRSRLAKHGAGTGTGADAAGAHDDAAAQDDRVTQSADGA